MNTYYGNLIEGHDTRPKDIERALAGNFDQDTQRRNLQLEAAAHVRVQAEIDRLAAAGALPEPASAQFISWLHSEFYRLMSHAMALNAGMGAHGLWSVSRGLARGLESRGEYKRMMDRADTHGL